MINDNDKWSTKLPDINFLTPYLPVLLDRIPLTARTFLEVGPGYGLFGYIIKKTRNPIVLDAIEPFYDDLPFYNNIQKCLWKDAIIDFKYDVIIATEVIEHMTHEEAINFLTEAKEKSKMVIIGTPINFVRSHAWDGNPYQYHQCVLVEEDFKKLDYKYEIWNKGNFLAFWESKN